MTLSVIIPAYNAEQTLPSLLDSLSQQSFKDFEVIVVDDCSKDSTARIVQRYAFNLIQLERNRGPAFCRNIGVKNAQGEILAFTDSDCRADHTWLENIHNHIIYDNIEAVMGRLILKSSTRLGDSISALGFPAGGSVGFDRIWRVDNNGYTESLSSCNCAIRKDIFNKIGSFDETFPYAGGEDSFLAYSLKQSGYRIKYCPDIIMYHEARDSLSEFLKWQFRRGVSSYIFSKKVVDKGKYISLRIWSAGNVIRYNLKDKKIPLIMTLLCIGILMQAAGALHGKLKGVK
ncbi:glycosyltransferase family 2 protein [Thermodesulfobacteriota bacterium]